MTHLPLTLGVTYTTAIGNVEITRLGKGGKWAFSSNNSRWNVKTGRHNHMPEASITGRVEPDRPDPNWIFSADAAPIEAELARVTAALEHWRQECGKLHSQVARRDHEIQQAREYRETLELSHNRVTAERDEAVALLQDADRVRPDFMSHSESCWYAAKNEFLAKIGAKP